jgi:hypothetical protein
MNLRPMSAARVLAPVRVCARAYRYAFRRASHDSACAARMRSIARSTCVRASACACECVRARASAWVHARACEHARACARDLVRHVCSAEPQGFAELDRHGEVVRNEVRVQPVGYQGPHRRSGFRWKMCALTGAGTRASAHAYGACARTRARVRAHARAHLCGGKAGAGTPPSHRGLAPVIDCVCVRACACVRACVRTASSALTSAGASGSSCRSEAAGFHIRSLGRASAVPRASSAVCVSAPCVWLRARVHGWV